MSVTTAPSSRASIRADRVLASIVIATVGFDLQFGLNIQSATASTSSWGVDDGCGNTNTTYYFAEGPAAFWHGYQYSGGTTALGRSCMMWTENVFTYISVVSDNTSYWYLPISPPNTWTGNYGTWAFEPAPNASTHQAIYQYWPYGHVFSQPAALCSFNQYGNALNVYAQLCARNIANPTWYFCADQNAGCGRFWRLTDATGEASLTTRVGSDDLVYCANNAAFSGCYGWVQSGFPLDYSSWSGAQIPNGYNYRCLDAATQSLSLIHI